MKIGIFGINSSSGVSFSKKNWKCDSKKVIASIKFADKCGYFDFILPISSWINFGGESQAHIKSYETFSLASILLSITKKIKIYSTVHVPFLHPVYASRMSASIGDFYKNRHGVNLVCGWSKKTFNIFNSTNYEKLLKARYNYAKEWTEIYKKSLFSKKKFSYKKKFFNIKNCLLLPKVENKNHKIISAAYSKEGQNFAIKNCDILFTFFSNLEKAKKQIKDIKKRNKKIKIYTTAHVVCRKTDQEAEKAYNYFALKHGDFTAAKNFVSQMPNKFVRSVNLKRLSLFTGSLGAFVIKGCPEKTLRQINEIKKCGFDGIALSFFDYSKEIKYFSNKVLSKF